MGNTVTLNRMASAYILYGNPGTDEDTRLYPVKRGYGIYIPSEDTLQGIGNDIRDEEHAMMDWDDIASAHRHTYEHGDEIRRHIGGMEICIAYNYAAGIDYYYPDDPDTSDEYISVSGVEIYAGESDVNLAPQSEWFIEYVEKYLNRI